MGFGFKNASRILLSLSTLSVYTAASAQTAQPAPEGTPFSVVYSVTQSRAFVGYLDETGRVAKFADCKAPRGDGSSSLDIIELTECRDIPGASFVYNRHNVARINAVFPEALRSVYSDEYRQDASRANVLNVLFFGSMTAGAAGVTGSTVRDAKASFIAGQRLQALGRILMGTAGGAVVLLGGTITYFSTKNALGFAKVPSLESRIIEHFQSALTKDENLKLIEITNQTFIDSFELLRKATIKSVERLSEV